MSDTASTAGATKWGEEDTVASTAEKVERKPRYLELADLLRADILAGRFDDTDGFPTEAVLCEEHGVSRFTVREALRKLQSEGLIKRRRGSGTMIQPASARAGALHQPLSNVDEILQYARDTQFMFKERGRVTLPKKYAEQAGLEVSGKWLHFSGIRTQTHDGLPIALTDAYVHPELAEAAQKIETARSTIFQQLEEHAGVSVSRVTQDIQAVAATAAVADQLEVPRRSPCLRILRSYLDDSGRAFEISVSHHPGHRFAYSMHIDVDS